MPFGEFVPFENVLSKIGFKTITNAYQSYSSGKVRKPFNLKNDKIYIAGIDFIDQKLNGDINVTSPTGLKTYYDLSKINLAKIFWKGLRAWINYQIKRKDLC